MELEGFGFADVIAQAARTHTCVRLTYKDEVRTVEPYSYRESKKGGTLFYGWHIEDNQIKAFALDKIQAVEPTEQGYEPRFAVEIA